MNLTTAVKYLTELRKRLLCYFFVLTVVFLIFLIYANKIYHLITVPLLQQLTHHSGLIAISLPATFLVPVKGALIASVFVTMPYFFYQLWMFIVPALYRQERKFVLSLLMTSSILFYLGVLFAYFIVLPLVFHFFIAIAPVGVEVKPDISQYFNFTTKLFFAFGLSFEVPVLIMLLVWLSICSIESLLKCRPYVIVGSFILGMLLTPPDVISQILLAAPLYLLYEFGLILSRWFVSKKIFAK